jgi:hypothetical protein
MAIAIDASSFSLRPSVVATVIEDGAVLLDLDTKYFFRLNASAWALVSSFEADGISYEQLCEVARELGAPEDDRAIAALLRELDSHGLIESASPTPSPNRPEFSGPWGDPAIEVQSEPLQSVVTSAFDPSVPLAE